MQCLLERYFHDLLIDALDLDIHLQCSDTRSGTRDFKVHIAKMILITKDIGQYSELIAFLDQTHGNACYGRLEWNASGHHSQ